MAKAEKLSGTFLIRGEHGLTRVVRTRDFKKRMSEWQASSPFELSLVGMVTNETTMMLLVRHLAGERWEDSSFHPEVPWRTSGFWCFCRLHSLLQEELGPLRVRGDWFLLPDETLRTMPLEHPQTRTD